MSRRARWWAFVVLSLALGAVSCGSGHGGAHGAAGTSGGAGAAGTTGASGTGGAAGTAGAHGTAGTSGGAGDAGLDAPTTMADGGTVDGGGAEVACGPMRLDRLAPDLLLLLDKSGSMADMLDGTRCVLNQPCVTRWGECTKAVNQVVQETETSVRWGLKYFANNAACGVTTGVNVEVGPGSATAIAASILSTAPGGDTPTRLAVTSAGDYLRGLTDPNPKVLLLATDGLPNCAPGGINIDVDDTPGTVAAVKMLADGGIPVYVIGIGSDVSDIQNLEDIAIAGGRPRPTTPSYYPVSSSADLVDDLRAIGAQSMPCSYALPSAPLNPGTVVISAANVVIPRDATHADGWDYDANMKSIQLYGTWCTKDQASALANVDETVPCP